MQLSISNCLTSAIRGAPSDSRTATSLARRDPRAMSRFAILTSVISRNTPVIANTY
jgi:hypothetical protein